jgi:hypothetical protein
MSDVLETMLHIGGAADARQASSGPAMHSMKHSFSDPPEPGLLTSPQARQTGPRPMRGTRRYLRRIRLGFL